MQNLSYLVLAKQEEGEERNEILKEESKISIRFETPRQGKCKTNNKLKMIILSRVIWFDFS
jgi:hypothetical protein